MNIDVLNLQETDLTNDINPKILTISGYKLELGKHSNKIRTSTYVKTGIKYKRRTDLEMEDGNIVVIDLILESMVRVANIYRPFRPANSPERQYFNHQLTTLENLIVENTIILGDFNLDINKLNDETYYEIHSLRDLVKFKNDNSLRQEIEENTWSRNILGVVKSLRIDHVYCTEDIKVIEKTVTPEAYSDHDVVIVNIRIEGETKEEERLFWSRDWYGYDRNKLVEELKRHNWHTNINDAQDYCNWLEEKLINIIDKLAPLTLRKCVNTRSYKSKQNSSLVYKHRKLVSRWKRNKNPEDRMLAAQIKKEIRISVNESRREKVRLHIRPGNPKSLWDAVKIAKDEDASPIPSEMTVRDKEKRGRNSRIFPDILSRKGRRNQCKYENKSNSTQRLSPVQRGGQKLHDIGKCNKSNERAGGEKL
jgi:hypothetical protein